MLFRNGDYCAGRGGGLDCMRFGRLLRRLGWGYWAGFIGWNNNQHSRVKPRKCDVGG